MFAHPSSLFPYSGEKATADVVSDCSRCSRASGEGGFDWRSFSLRSPHVSDGGRKRGVEGERVSERGRRGSRDSRREASLHSPAFLAASHAASLLMHRRGIRVSRCSHVRTLLPHLFPDSSLARDCSTGPSLVDRTAAAADPLEACCRLSFLR